MGQRAKQNIQRVEGISQFNPNIIYTRGWRRVVLVFTSFRGSIECCIGKRGKQEAKDSILYKQDVTRCWNKVQQFREMVLAFVVAKKELWYYFESHLVIVVTNLANFVEAKSVGKIEKVGNWTWDLWDQIYSKKRQVILDFLVEIQSFDPSEWKVNGVARRKNKIDSYVR